jgi:hypothetical protein
MICLVKKIFEKVAINSTEYSVLYQIKNQLGIVKVFLANGEVYLEKYYSKIV